MSSGVRAAVSQIASVMPQPTSTGLPVTSMNVRCSESGSSSPPVNTVATGAKSSRCAPSCRTICHRWSTCAPTIVGCHSRRFAWKRAASNSRSSAIVAPRHSSGNTSIQPPMCPTESCTTMRDDASTGPSADSTLRTMPAADPCECSTPFGNAVEPDV